MKKRKHGMARPLGIADRDLVGIGEWKAFRVGGDGQGDRLPSEAVGSLSLEENRDMITANRIQGPWDRLATVAERLMELAERQFCKDEQEKPQSTDYLTPTEVSAILRVHVQTVMEWCRDGKLEAFKSGGNPINGKGGKWVIPRESVDHYLRRHQLIHGSRKGGAK
jgi:excisionase family DNA binding protein